MTEKERIIELVKNNVISMDEALQLLEAAAKNDHQAQVTSNEFIEEYKNAQKDIEEKVEASQLIQMPATDEQEEQAQQVIQEKFEQASEELAKKQEALVIAKQRLREIEIFAELDDLTEDMKTQQANLMAKIDHLEAEIEELSIEIDIKRQEMRQNTQSQIKKMVEDTTEQVTKAAKNFGEEAKKEGKNLQKTIMGYVKEWASNFDMKEFNVNVPWVKSQSFAHQYQFDATDIDKIEVKILNGNVKVETHPKDNIIVDLDIVLYGKEEVDNIAAFESLSTIDGATDKLIINMMNPRVAVETLVKVPSKVFSELFIDTINGDVDLKDLKAKEVKLSSKNGDNEVADITADLLVYDGYNGDFKIKDSEINDIDYHVLNGNLRYVDQVGNLKVDAVNGDIVITKTNSESSIINAKTLSGDIKIAVPQMTNLEIEAESTYGEVHHRLNNVNQTGSHIGRQVDGEHDLIKLTIASTSGNIYLKD